MGEIYVLFGVILIATGWVKSIQSFIIIGSIFLVGGSIVRRMKR